MSIIIKSGSSTSLASVDANNNLQVNTPVNPDISGFTTLTTESDDGTVTGTRKLVNPESSDDYRLRTGLDQTFFNEYFPGTTINGNIWNTLVTGHTISVAGNFANLNGTVTSGNFSQLRTWRHSPVFMTFPTYCEIDLQFTSVPITNNVCEWGLGLASAATAPTDVAFFRINAQGEFRAVLSVGGSEVLGADISAQLPTINTTNDYLIVLSEKNAEYWINDILVDSIPRSSNAGSTTASMNLPLFVRQYNSNTASTAMTIKVGYVNISLGDMNTVKPWPHLMAGAGSMAYQAQTGAATLGSTSNLLNSLPATSTNAALSNTTAVLGNGLGGQFSIQPTLTAGTDGIVFSYQVPTGTSTLPGKSLYVTGVKIQGAVTTVLAGGPVVADVPNAGKYT
jgi:hypothetical protein